MSAPDPDGQVGLMLCESILHLLVEEGVISNEKALGAINGVVELTRENDAQLGPKGRDLNLEVRRSLTHRFPRQERCREPALLPVTSPRAAASV
jgi:hypothetical protein